MIVKLKKKKKWENAKIRTHVMNGIIYSKTQKNTRLINIKYIYFYTKKEMRE